MFTVCKGEYLQITNINIEERTDFLARYKFGAMVDDGNFKSSNNGKKL